MFSDTKRIWHRKENSQWIHLSKEWINVYISVGKFSSDESH